MWEVVDYNHDDLDKLVDLIKENYGDIEIANKEFLIWQYELNPDGKAIIKLAVDNINNAVVGHCAVIPVSLKVGNEVIKGTLAINTLTKKEYRGQGIFTKLVLALHDKCREMNLAFTYNFPNPNSYPGYIKKIKSVELGRVPLLIKYIKKKKAITEKLERFMSYLIAPVQYFFKLKSERLDTIMVYEINNNNVSDMDLLWEKVKDNYKIMEVRNASFVKWRYLDIPLRKYKILCVKEDGEVQGYIVGICKEVKGIKFGMIVDFITNVNNAKAGHLLIKHLLRHLSEQGAEFSGVLMQKHAKEYGLLKKSGFYKCPKFLEPQPIRVLYKPHMPEGDQKITYDINNWFLTMGDFDVI